MQSKPLHHKIGDAAFGRMDKINSELLTLTYGALVTQLLRDYESVDEVNKKLDQMGYNIGLRLIDELIAKSNLGRCENFKETCEVIAKVGFKMFLGVTATVTAWNNETTECSLILEENPLNDFVELPEHFKDLNYSQLYCGIIRGALEMIHLKVECKFAKDTLRGDEATEIRLTLVEIMPEFVPIDDDK